MRFDILLRLPSERMSFELFEQLISDAVEAELLGFRTAWLVESPDVTSSCFCSSIGLLAAIAGHTRRIHLGVIANRPAWPGQNVLAEHADVLDVLSGGRAQFACAVDVPKGDVAEGGCGSADGVRDFVQCLSDGWLRKSRLSSITHSSWRLGAERTLRLIPSTARSFQLAGAWGYPILAGAPILPAPALRENLAAYRAAANGAAIPLPSDWLSLAVKVEVPSGARDDDNKLQFESVGSTKPHGPYIINGKECGNEPFDVIAGEDETLDLEDPDTCVERIWKLKVGFGFTTLICSFGVESVHDRVAESMMFFAERVMPAFAEVP